MLWSEVSEKVEKELRERKGRSHKREGTVMKGHHRPVHNTINKPQRSADESKVDINKTRGNAAANRTEQSDSQLCTSPDHCL